MWASFNLDSIINYANSGNVVDSSSTTQPVLNEGDKLIKLGNNIFGIKDVNQNWYIQE